MTQIFLASAHWGRSMRSMGCPADKRREEYLWESPLIIMVMTDSEHLMRMLKTWKLAENCWRKMRSAWWAVEISVQEYPNNRRKLEKFDNLKHHKNCVLLLKKYISEFLNYNVYTKRINIWGKFKMYFFLHSKTVCFCSHSWRSDSKK